VDLNGSIKALLSTIARLDSISVSDPVASREEKGTFSIFFLNMVYLRYLKH
jgi:hypothetical protein